MCTRHPNSSLASTKCPHPHHKYSFLVQLPLPYTVLTFLWSSCPLHSSRKTWLDLYQVCQHKMDTLIYAVSVVGLCKLKTVLNRLTLGLDLTSRCSSTPMFLKFQLAWSSAQLGCILILLYLIGIGRGWQKGIIALFCLFVIAFQSWQVNLVWDIVLVVTV